MLVPRSKQTCCVGYNVVTSTDEQMDTMFWNTDFRPEYLVTKILIQSLIFLRNKGSYEEQMLDYLRRYQYILRWNRPQSWMVRSYPKTNHHHMDKTAYETILTIHIPSNGIVR